MDFGILLLFIILAVGSFLCGYKFCDNIWKEKMEERMTELVLVELEKIKALYEETYRNVFRSLLASFKEAADEEKN